MNVLRAEKLSFFKQKIIIMSYFITWPLQKYYSTCLKSINLFGLLNHISYETSVKILKNRLTLI